MLAGAQALSRKGRGGSWRNRNSICCSSLRASYVSLQATELRDVLRPERLR